MLIFSPLTALQGKRASFLARADAVVVEGELILPAVCPGGRGIRIQPHILEARNIPHWGIYYAGADGSRDPDFSRQADKLFNEEERRELIDFLAENPLAGDRIPGTGGVRKLRFAAAGRGKRGGARVIYYFLDNTVPI